MVKKEPKSQKKESKRYSISVRGVIFFIKKKKKKKTNAGKLYDNFIAL